MNCDLWRSNGRIFAHWTYLYFSLCLWVVIFCLGFVILFCPGFVKPKNLKKNLKTIKNYFSFKIVFFSSPAAYRSIMHV